MFIFTFNATPTQLVFNPFLTAYAKRMSSAPVSVKVSPPWGLYTGDIRLERSPSLREARSDRASPTLRNTQQERAGNVPVSAPSVEVVGSVVPRQFGSSQKVEEDRDKRSVSEMVAEEKKILRSIESLQKAEESLKNVVADLKRSKGKKSTLDPIVEAKEEELLLKQRTIAENAASLRKLRDLRAQLESAISEKKISQLIHKSRERITVALHRDPSIVLAGFREEEARLAEQERALEHALADEIEAEEIYEKEGNQAGACCTILYSYCILL